MERELSQLTQGRNILASPKKWPNSHCGVRHPASLAAAEVVVAEHLQIELPPEPAVPGAALDESIDWENAAAGVSVIGGGGGDGGGGGGGGDSPGSAGEEDEDREAPDDPDDPDDHQEPPPFVHDESPSTPPEESDPSWRSQEKPNQKKRRRKKKAYTFRSIASPTEGGKAAPHRLQQYGCMSRRKARTKRNKAAYAEKGYKSKLQVS